MGRGDGERRAPALADTPTAAAKLTAGRSPKSRSARSRAIRSVSFGLAALRIDSVRFFRTPTAEAAAAASSAAFRESARLESMMPAIRIFVRARASAPAADLGGDGTAGPASLSAAAAVSSVGAVASAGAPSAGAAVVVSALSASAASASSAAARRAAAARAAAMDMVLSCGALARSRGKS